MRKEVEAMDKKTVGQRLKKLRGSESQVKVAEALGILPSSLSMYESGQRTPSDEVKIKIAKYFNTTVQAIFF